MNTERLAYQVSVLREVQAIFVEYDERHLTLVMQCYADVLQAKINRMKAEAVHAR